MEKVFRKVELPGEVVLLVESSTNRVESIMRRPARFHCVTSEILPNVKGTKQKKAAVAARDVPSNILSLCVLSPLQYHLSLIDDEWTYSDSTGDLGKLCQIPVHCLCQFAFGLAFASRNFCKLLVVSCEVFVLLE